MSDIEQVLAEVAALRATFLADVPAMTDNVERLLRPLRADPDASREELIRTVHSLAGTSETFGLSAIGQPARHLEDLLERTGPVDFESCTEEVRQMRVAILRPWRIHPAKLNLE